MRDKPPRSVQGAHRAAARPGPDAESSEAPEAEASGGATRGFRPLGLRREIVLLIPLALLLLLSLSAFTLISYRGGIDRLIEERREEALRLARHAAVALVDQPRPSESRLRRLAPTALGVALLDSDGFPLVVAGELATFGEVNERVTVEPATALAFGPSDELGDVVTAFAPLGSVDARSWIRLDLPVAALGAQRRSLTTLTWLVGGIDALVALVLLLFLGRLLAPIDSLLDQARRAGAGTPQNEDEVAFLLSTFDRALDALTGGETSDEASDEATGVDQDIAAIERTLAPSLASGALLLDRQGKVLALNSIGARLLGSRPIAPGTALETALADHPSLAALLARAISQQQGISRYEYALDDSSSEGTSPEERILGLTLHPLRRDEGRVRGFLVLFADLTEAKRAARESRLAESLQQVGELAAGVAHELRNSLATIKGYLGLIERRPGEASVDEYLAEIHRESDHLQRVLEDFLAFARPGSARPETIDLSAILRRASADPALAGARIEVGEVGKVGEVGGDNVALRGDPQLLERAIRNLLHNGVEAGRQLGDGRLETSIQTVDDGVELRIADRGPGVAEELRDRLFHPFSTGRDDGVGLGLALAQRIIHLHGGRLRLDDREGGGTVAIIYLPSGGPSGKNVTEGINSTSSERHPAATDPSISA